MNTEELKSQYPEIELGDLYPHFPKISLAEDQRELMTYFTLVAEKQRDRPADDARTAAGRRQGK